MLKNEYLLKKSCKPKNRLSVRGPSFVSGD